MRATTRAAAAFALLVMLVHDLAPPTASAATRSRGAGARPAVTAAPLGKSIDWSEAQDGAAHTYVAGNLRLTASSRGDDCLLAVQGPGAAKISLKSECGGGPSSSFMVARLEADNTAPGVIFTTNSGGHHCCSMVTMAFYRGGRWTAKALGEYETDAEPGSPADLDGDGVPELIAADSRFDYAFDDFARSRRPIIVYNIRGGKLIDVTRSKPALVEKEADAYGAECRQHINGACAAYVADMARLGRVREAWRVMLADHDRRSGWDYWPCTNSGIGAECPPGTPKGRDMAVSLKGFLIENGYMNKAQAAMVR